MAPSHSYLLRQLMMMLSPSLFPPLLASALALLVGSLTVSPVAAQSLSIGKLSEIEGDVTCSSTFRTGGTLVYAETANYRVYVCSDRNNPDQPRYYRSFDKQGGTLTLAAMDYNPRKPDSYEFRNRGYRYTLQIPSAQSTPVLRVTLPNGKRYEEKILRFLTTDSPASGEAASKRDILSYFDRNRSRLGVCQESNQAEAAQYSEVFPVGDRRSLVQFRCFLGAYQGGYEFYLYDNSAAQVKVKSLNLRQYRDA
ncbi:MAG TPA: hypothetical protein V6D18_11775, partial [Thermosynechococcaceae cyanobacterium]